MNNAFFIGQLPKHEAEKRRWKKNVKQYLSTVHNISGINGDESPDNSVL